MFNFASKLINTIGDLVSVEEPPKSQPPQQPQSLQRRASGGDARNFQQKPRFFGPGAVDYESTFRRGAAGAVGSGSGPSVRGPSSTTYRYPSGPTLTNYGPTATSSYGPSTSSSGSSTTSGYGQSNSTYGSGSGSAFGSTTGSGSSGYCLSTSYGSNSSGYRSDRYEENAFKTPDIDYNEGKLMRNLRF